MRCQISSCRSQNYVVIVEELACQITASNWGQHGIGTVQRHPYVGYDMDGQGQIKGDDDEFS